MIVLQSEIDELIGAVMQAGGNVLNDYILVIGNDAELLGVMSPIQVEVDNQLNGVVYLVKRTDYFHKNKEK